MQYHKVICKISAQHGKACRRKVRKLCISSILSSKRGITPTNIDVYWQHSTWSVLQYDKVICKISAQYIKACRRKVRKTVYFQYSKFQKGRNSYKHWHKLTTLELDLQYSIIKSYAKFQLNMSKHVGEKCGKQCISSILSSKRGITPSNIDANWRHSNLICNTVKQSHMQNFSSMCQSMYEKNAENCVFPGFKHHR